MALQLLMKTLVALLQLLFVTDECCQAMQRTRVQVISVTPHHSTQGLRLTDHLRPRLRCTTVKLTMDLLAVTHCSHKKNKNKCRSISLHDVLCITFSVFQ